MNEEIPIERLAWAIDARMRSQKLLLAFHEFDKQRSDRLPESPNAEVFGLLVGVAFSLWRASFLADAPTRTWEEALEHAQDLLEKVLSTNAIAFGTEHALQGWTAGYYLNNAKLRLQEILRRQARLEDLARVEGISLLRTDPHETWVLFCAEAEQLAEQLGCRLR